MKSLWEFMGPGPESNHTGMAARPDSSGVRGGLKRPLQKRPSNYPYDKKTFYGTPQAYDRGSSGRSEMHQPITPKDTSHSAWDDIEEAMGTPEFLTRATNPGLGGATGIPGGVGEKGWASNPSKTWDEPEIDESGYLDASSFTPDAKNDVVDIIPIVPKLVVKKKIDMSMPSHKNPEDIFFVGTPGRFKSGTGNSLRTSRNVGGLMPKESAWDWLKNKTKE